MPLTNPPAVILTFFQRYGPVAAGGVAVFAGAVVTLPRGPQVPVVVSASVAPPSGVAPPPAPPLPAPPAPPDDIAEPLPHPRAAVITRPNAAWRRVEISTDKILPIGNPPNLPRVVDGSPAPMRFLGL